MNKFNVYIVAIITAGFVTASAIWGTVVVLDSPGYGKGMFDYLIIKQTGGKSEAKQ